MIRFIATRLNTSGAGQVSRPAIVIATCGVAIGLMVMVLTLCISFGFKRSIREMVHTMGGDMQVYNSGSIEPATTPTLVATDSIMDAVRAIGCVERAERVSTVLGCLKTDSAFLGIQLVGRESQELAEGEIVISTTQADRLGLAVGDRIMAYFFDESIRARRFTVVDTYATNLSDFDATQVFASYSTVRTLAGQSEGECNYLQLYCCQPGDEASSVLRAEYGDAPGLCQQMMVLRKVKELFPLTPYCQPTLTTLEEMHPQVFSWLDLLDLNVWVILALMLCVSGFTMASGLFILILERTQMIGLLKALGARFSTLRHIFLYIAARILVRGMLIGNALALALALAQKQWHIVRLNPADYYVDAVPIALPWSELATLNICTMLLTIAVLIVPTYIIGHISPVKAMRFD